MQRDSGSDAQADNQSAALPFLRPTPLDPPPGVPPRRACAKIPKVPIPQTRSPELKQIAARGLQFAVWEWPGEDPPLLFAHATSFHGRCWDPVIGEFPGRRCVAIEARGHGRSSKPEPPYHWGGFVLDMLAVTEGLGLEGAIGIGHSMGGHTVTAVAAARPNAFRGLVLVDPTMWPPEAYGAAMDVAFVRKRRARWSSPDQMFDHFRHRPPFEHWKPEMLRAYCDFGLLPDAGEFVLACPPDIEASIYECSKEPEANLQDVIPAVTQPVTVLRAGYAGERRFSTSPTDPLLASRLPRGRDVLLAERSHFIPMEAPEVVARHIRELLRSAEA